MMDRFTGFTRIISLMVITWEAKKSWKVILFSIMRKNLKKIEETQQKYSFKINNCEFLGNRNMSRCKCKILKFSNPLNSWYLNRVSNVIDYSLKRNYVQLRVITFISCNFAGLRVIEEISISRNYGVISRNFYNVISRNFVMITRNKRNSNYA